MARPGSGIQALALPAAETTTLFGMPSHFGPTVRKARWGEGMCQARPPHLRVAIQWEAKTGSLKAVPKPASPGHEQRWG